MALAAYSLQPIAAERLPALRRANPLLSYRGHPRWRCTARRGSPYRTPTSPGGVLALMGESGSLLAPSLRCRDACNPPWGRKGACSVRPAAGGARIEGILRCQGSVGDSDRAHGASLAMQYGTEFVQQWP